MSSVSVVLHNLTSQTKQNKKKRELVGTEILDNFGFVTKKKKGQGQMKSIKITHYYIDPHFYTLFQKTLSLSQVLLILILNLIHRNQHNTDI